MKTAAWSIIDKVKVRNDSEKNPAQSLAIQNKVLVQNMQNQSNQFLKSIDMIGDKNEHDVNCCRNQIKKLEDDIEVESVRNEKKLKIKKIK